MKTKCFGHFILLMKNKETLQKYGFPMHPNQGRAFLFSSCFCLVAAFCSRKTYLIAGAVTWGSLLEQVFGMVMEELK